MTFNPSEHLSKVSKPNDYLQVKWRLVWFRDEHPHGKITTSMVQLDTEKQFAVFKATVEDSAGGLAEGYGSESVKDFKDYIEKAETKAIGRALAGLGYGTQFAPDLDEGERIVDSPVERKASSNGHTAAKPTLAQIEQIAKGCKTLKREAPTVETYEQADALLRQLADEYRAKAGSVA